MQNTTELTFFSPPSKQSAAASSVYRSKGHDDDDFSATTRSKTNVVSASAGLNEATCAIKSQFVCAVKHKQAAVGAGKEKKKKKRQESNGSLAGSSGGI